MKNPWDDGILTISGNRKYLVHGSQPFFWQGDTAWDLFQRLSEEEAAVYLQNRKEKKFNVIQSVLINFAHEDDKTSYQHVENQDIMNVIDKQNEAYWRHVDQIVDKAAELGLYFGLLPVWGKVVRDTFINMGNVEAYGKFLVKTFGHKKNIIWILGGDIRGNEHFELWNCLGTYLKKNMPNTLITYHPFGRTSSSYWFASCEWLDFHMFQSGHRRYDQKNLNTWDEANQHEPWFGEDNWRYVLQDHKKTPLKPVLDGEPSYEQIPQGLHDGSQPYWQAHHVRRYAYWSVLSGACGHTYGHNSIFQMNGTGFKAEFSVKESWTEAIHAAGSGQIQFLQQLMHTIDFTTGRPLQYLICPEENCDVRENKIVAFGNEKNILVYHYSGDSFGLKGSEGFDGDYDGFWIDPVNGVRSYFGKFALDKGVMFKPPIKKTDFTDWVLLLCKR